MAFKIAIILGAWFGIMSIYWATQDRTPFYSPSSSVVEHESEGDGVIVMPRSVAPYGGVSIGGGLVAY